MSFKNIPLIIFISLISFVGYGAKRITSLPSVLIQDTGGNSIDLSKLSPGKTIVISYWATWCAPCKAELSEYNTRYKDWATKYNTTFIAISVDKDKTFNGIKKFASAKSWTFPTYLDNKDTLSSIFKIEALPYLMIIDKTGKIIEKKAGFDKDIAKLEFKLEMLK